MHSIMSIRSVDYCLAHTAKNVHIADIIMLRVVCAVAGWSSARHVYLFISAVMIHYMLPNTLTHVRLYLWMALRLMDVTNSTDGADERMSGSRTELREHVEYAFTNEYTIHIGEKRAARTRQTYGKIEMVNKCAKMRGRERERELCVFIPAKRREWTSESSCLGLRQPYIRSAIAQLRKPYCVVAGAGRIDAVRKRDGHIVQKTTTRVPQIECGSSSDDQRVQVEELNRVCVSVVLVVVLRELTRA